MKSKCLLSFLLLFSYSFLYADSPVWKVSKGDDYLYIGGTIHLLGKSDYPLPSGFEQAYAQAQKVVFETDIAKVNSLEFAQQLLGHVMYPPGTDLTKVLKADTFKALKEHFQSRGMPIEAMLNFKIGMIIVTLSTIELQRLGVAGEGVDKFYNNRSLIDKKTIGYLESPAQQIIYIADMGKGMEDKVIEHTLRDLKTLPKVLKSLKFAWRKGDNKKLQEIGIEPFKQDYPAVYHSLLVRRNNAWLGQIESMVGSDEIELVLVGALHLVGDDGILKLLTDRGYHIEKL